MLTPVIKLSYGDNISNGQKINDINTIKPSLPILSRFKIITEEIIMNSSGGTVTQSQYGLHH